MFLLAEEFNSRCGASKVEKLWMRGRVVVPRKSLDGLHRRSMSGAICGSEL